MAPHVPLGGVFSCKESHTSLLLGRLSSFLSTFAQWPLCQASDCHKSPKTHLQIWVPIKILNTQRNYVIDHCVLYPCSNAFPSRQESLSILRMTSPSTGEASIGGCWPSTKTLRTLCELDSCILSLDLRQNKTKKRGNFFNFSITLGITLTKWSRILLPR